MTLRYDPTICIPGRFTSRGAGRPRNDGDISDADRSIRYPISARKLILKFLPSFCWQTRFEVVTMMEQIAEDMPAQLIATALQQMWMDGEVERRSIVTARKPGQVINLNANRSPHGVYEFKRPVNPFLEYSSA
jgi:hypothetical protein